VAVLPRSPARAWHYMKQREKRKEKKRKEKKRKEG
jgi:hypothetical protein